MLELTSEPGYTLSLGLSVLPPQFALIGTLPAYPRALCCSLWGGRRRGYFRAKHPWQQLPSERDRWEACIDEPQHSLWCERFPGPSTRCGWREAGADVPRRCGYPYTPYTLRARVLVWKNSGSPGSGAHSPVQKMALTRSLNHRILHQQRLHPDVGQFSAAVRIRHTQPGTIIHSPRSPTASSWTQ